MEKELKAILEGTVGFFWPSSISGHRDDDPERGFAKREDRGTLEIRTLNEHPDTALFMESGRERPYFIQALYPEGSAVILDISRHGRTTNIGGRRASTYTYSARTAFSRVPPEKIRDVRVRELRAFFPGISMWSGVKVANIKHERKTDGRSRSATLTLRAPEEMVAKVGSLSLAIGGHWEIKDDHDRASTYSPVAISIRANRPRPPEELVKALVRIQDLLCVAHDAFVPADGGIALMGIDPNPREYPSFWNSTLMETAANGIIEAPKLSFPLFDLNGANGVKGISRWIRLHDELPVPMGAVTAPYRLGRMTRLSYLTETAVGIEHLVAKSKDKGRPAWTKAKPPSLALALRMGPPFAEFTGDPKKWAELFWNTYNGAKHQPNYSPDPRDLETLAISGNLLLTTYLLQRCGMKKNTIDHMLQHRVSYHIRNRVRELVKNPPANLTARKGY